ncbi:hypothetical protein NY2A_b260R [Paramecium bursaria Chlorella virus NY2A]|uniref:Uncharacterized protein b260R n=1 Tax=Paramecium bursaria Chlorella virus NY2A TaxID=46021 RepID=A7IWD5_PBCVN|nr:hypothetical protein NY2A_b260R [Paramecium bursaria Chlorella virus NY2A]ABT14659.1 hypothetical protein NY2A_b260R [Paramecium bursaria Chlorella virus NY2A]
MIRIRIRSAHFQIPTTCPEMLHYLKTDHIIRKSTIVIRSVRLFLDRKCRMTHPEIILVRSDHCRDRT